MKATHSPAALFEYGICSIFFSVLLFLACNYVSAQSDATKVRTYENSDFGYSLQYPSSWKVDEDRSSEGLVQFFTSDHGSHLAIFTVGVEDSTRNLDTDTLTLKNTSAQQYAEERLTSLSETSDTTDFKQIRSNEFTIAGNPAWKIEYSVDFSNADLPKELAKAFSKGPEYNFEIFTVSNGKLFTLSYNEELPKVPETFPLANETVNSFRFT
jgi:hypothetical protein